MFSYNKKIILSWLQVFLWMLFIFFLSAQPATQSNGLSKNVTKIIIEIIGKIIPFDIQTGTFIHSLTQFNHIIRKSAHFLEYFVLGLLVMNAFVKSGVSGFKSLGCSLLFCFLYAMSDEFHQLIVPGRGGQAKDVMIDSTGAFFGIIFFKVISIFHIKITKFKKLL